MRIIGKNDETLIRRRRRELGLTQTDLAEKIAAAGISMCSSRVGTIERQSQHRHSIHEEVLEAFAVALDLDKTEVFNDWVSRPGPQISWETT